MLKAKNVTKNSFYSMGSSIIQKFLTLGYFVIVARSFGPADQGRYSAAIAFATLFSVFAELGLSSVLTRETARNPHHAHVYLNQMVIIRLVLGVCVYGLTIVSAHIFGYSSELISMIEISGIAAMIDTLTTSCWFLLRGFQNLLYESIGALCAVVAMIGFGVFVVVEHMPVSFLVYAVLFGSCVNLSVAFWTLFLRAHLRLHLRPDFSAIKSLLILALPFAGAAIFSRIYTFSDVSILAKLSGEHAVGWYSAGNKLVLALNIIPGALSASIYPAMSSYFVSARERLSHITEKAISLLLIIVVPLAVGTAVLAEKIVPFFYGPSYLPTIHVLQVLSVSMVFGFIAYPLGALLAATNRQGVNTLIFGIAAAVNVIGNSIVARPFGAVGAAAISALTTLVIFIMSAYVQRSVLYHAMKFLGPRCVRIAVSAAIMALCIWLFKLLSIPLLLNMAIGIVMYGMCIFFTRAVTAGELRDIRHRIIHS